LPYLTPVVQAFFIDHETKLDQIQKKNDQQCDNKSSSNTHMSLFRDFRIHSDKSNDGDIRFFGNIKKDSIPPGDTLNTAYGTSVVELREYIHKRVTSSENGTMRKWEARTLSEFMEFLDCGCAVTGASVYRYRERIALNRTKNNPSQQRAFESKIYDEQQKRVHLATDIEKIDLIHLLINILSHENSDIRSIALQEFIYGIEAYAAAAIEDARMHRDDAFARYEDMVRSKSKCKAIEDDYFQAKAKYAATTVGIEHIWRECCHLYIADSNRYASYPGLAAQYLMDEFALELLDGDAGMMCGEWIRQVLIQLNEKLKHLTKKKSIRIFVLSIIGVQSSGKSTLLNIMFGVRLRASTGQCTRGINIQLLKSEERDEYDYVLLLDTEGLRAPECKDVEYSEWKDNRMATFAVLPADATIILVNGEQDGALKDVLSIVALAYEQSQLAEKSGGHLASMMFCVYCRVDINQISNLIPVVQAFFIDHETKLDQIQKKNDQQCDNKSSSNTHMSLFRDFRIHSDKSNDGDIRFFGNIKKDSIPPGDTLNTAYGTSVVELREYIHKRVTSSENGTMRKWEARTLSEFMEFLDCVWQCILSADFTLTFASAMERNAHEQLDEMLSNARHQLGSLYNNAYSEIERKIVTDADAQTSKCSLTSMTNEQSKQRESDVHNKIEKYSIELNTLVYEQLKKIDQGVIDSLENNKWQKWKIDRLAEWKSFKNMQIDHWKNVVIGERVHSLYLFDVIVNTYQRRLRNTIKQMFRNQETNGQQLSEENQSETFDQLFQGILDEAERHHPLAQVQQSVLWCYQQDTAGRRWDLQLDYINSKFLTDFKVNATEHIRRLMIKCFGKYTQLEKESELLYYLLLYIVDQLKNVTCYSNHVVEQAIRETTKRLTDAKMNYDSIQERAHKLVYNLLVIGLTEIQDKWNVANNILTRLKSEKNTLWKFFVNTSKGVAGAKLL
ncbi:unnamed protein product, partial [Didymodactylos carnosus]